VPSSRRDDAPIFVVGAARSGTTFLAESLGRHPAIAHFPREADFIPFFFEWMESGPDLEPQEKARLGRDFLGGWLGAFLEKTGKSRVLEKTPPNLYAMNWLLACFPRSQIVHIYRDPRAVVASVIEALGKMNQRSAPAAARLWRDMVEVALAKEAAAAGGRCTSVRYEALVADPVSEFGRVLAFLGESVDPIAGHVRTRTDRSRVNRWREILSPQEIDEVEEICSDLMSRLGYAPSSREASPSR